MSTPERFNLPKAKKQEKIEKEIERQKETEKTSRFLFIDDDRGLLSALQSCFPGQNVVFAECHSVKDALQAIAKYQPEAIFLDHHLTEGMDGEGLEIADRTKGVKIYSTTSDSSAREEYQKRGIENVKKYDLSKFRSIIAGEQKNEK